MHCISSLSIKLCLIASLHILFTQSINALHNSCAASVHIFTEYNTLSLLHEQCIIFTLSYSCIIRAYLLATLKDWSISRRGKLREAQSAAICQERFFPEKFRRKAETNVLGFPNMEIFIRNAFSWEIRGKAERTFNYFPSRGKVPDALLENLGNWWTWVLCPLSWWYPPNLSTTGSLSD